MYTIIIDSYGNMDFTKSAREYYHGLKFLMTDVEYAIKNHKEFHAGKNYNVKYTFEHLGRKTIELMPHRPR